MVFTCAYFVAMRVTLMSFAFVTRGLRRDMWTMLETHILMNSLIFHPILTLVLRLALLLVLSHFSHGPNHRSYGFGL
jgi:hypothetical protein